MAAQRKTSTKPAAQAGAASKLANAPAKAAPASKPAAPAASKPAAPADSRTKVDITSRVGAWLIDQGGEWANRVGEVAPRKSGKRSLRLDDPELRELVGAVQGMVADGTALDQRSAAALLAKLQGATTA
jgi:hypothetical protein